MDTESSQKPKIFIDLNEKKNYFVNGEKLVVDKLKSYNHNAYIQVLDSNISTPELEQNYIQLNGLNVPTFLPNLKGSFDISYFQINQEITLITEIKDVSTVTVYYDKNSGKEIVLFEILSYRKDHTSIFRYFARKRFGSDKKLRWVEYMFRNNEMLDNDKIEVILKHYDESKFLSSIKVDGTYMTIVTVYSDNKDKCKRPESNEANTFNTDYFHYDGKRPDNFKGIYGIPYPLEQKNSELTQDLERQIQVKEQNEKKKTNERPTDQEFIHTKLGMGTVIGTGSVGGIAIGGGMIYLVSHFR